MSKYLLDFLENGIRTTNFFNGRILTAEDLSQDQAANNVHHQQLGRALGEGVVSGLEVRLVSAGGKGQQSAVAITKGLAVNRAGSVLELKEDIVTLAFTPEEKTAVSGEGLFAACDPVSAAPAATGTGVYVLVICPSSEYRDRAPMAGLGEGRGASCGRKYLAEGVLFNLVRLNVENLTKVSQATRDEISQLMRETNEPGVTDPAKLSKLRNLLAHLCFGTEELAEFARDPFKPAQEGTPPYLKYGALDSMRELKCLTNDDVPLALVYWTTKGVQIVDMWTVRRRVTAADASVLLPAAVNDRKQAESEAMFLQFQEQLGEIAESPSTQSLLGSVAVTDYFRYLPAAGILPIAAGYIQEYQQAEGAKPIPILKQQRGLYPPKFFEGLTTRKPVFIEGALFEPLFKTARRFPPIDLTSKELIWLYLVRENIESTAKEPLSKRQLYLIFAIADVPYQGNARFDVAKWDYSNYAFV